MKYPVSVKFGTGLDFISPLAFHWIKVWFKAGTDPIFFGFIELIDSGSGLGK